MANNNKQSNIMEEGLIKNLQSNRESLIKNIQNCNSLPNNVVVSAILGLCHVAENGDEKIILPLLEHSDKVIAAVALSSLCLHFGFTQKLLNRIIQFAAQYPSGENEESDESELQRTAIFILSDLAKNDDDLLNQLIEIAENYHNILECSDAASMNAYIWESLAELCGQKIKGDESIVLTWNPQSRESELIRDRIRASIRKPV